MDKGEFGIFFEKHVESEELISFGYVSRCKVWYLDINVGSKILIELDNKLYQAKYLGMSYKFFGRLNSPSEHIHLNIATIGEVEVSLASVDRLYLSMEYFRKNITLKGELTYEALDDVVADVLGNDFTLVGDNFYRYEWNGIKPVKKEIKVSDVLRYDGEDFYFKTIDVGNTYATIDECNEYNTPKVITFEDEDKEDDAVEILVLSLSNDIVVKAKFDRENNTLIKVWSEKS